MAVMNRIARYKPGLFILETWINYWQNYAKQKNNINFILDIKGKPLVALYQ